MNNHITRPWPQAALFLALLASIACVLAFQTGCGTTGQTRAYQTLAATQAAVEAAEQTFKMLNREGEVTAEEYDRIAEARAKYQISMRTAIAMARRDLTELTPEQTYQLSIELIRLIERIRQ